MDRNRHLGCMGCLVGRALGGREQSPFAGQQDFHCKGHPLSCLLLLHPPHRRQMAFLPLFEKQSIFPETRMLEAFVLDLGLSGLEDLEAHRREMRLWDSRKAQSPLRVGPYQCNPPLSLCLRRTWELLSPVQVSVMQA